jgi:hypothetical protein
MRYVPNESALPLYEQQEREAARYEDVLNMRITAAGQVVANTPDGLRVQLDNVLELYSTGKVGERETIGALGALVMRAIRLLEEAELHGVPKLAGTDE